MHVSEEEMIVMSAMSVGESLHPAACDMFCSVELISQSALPAHLFPWLHWLKVAA